MTTIMQAAKDYVFQNRDREILQTELLRHVSSVTGKSLESVRGTVCKSVGVYNPALLASNGLKLERQPTRLVPGVAKIYQSYDCPVKHSVRDRIFSHVKATKPKITTFAGHEGLCVKHAFAKFDKPVITNIEANLEALSEFCKLNLKTINFSGKFSKYLENPQAPQDLLFYDSFGYFCDYMACDFDLLNTDKKFKTIAITLLGIRRFRNKGSIVTTCREIYGELTDPTKQAMLDLFHNYSLSEEIWYKKSNVKGARQMRVFIFNRR